ncbi:MAG: peptidylprolyl isomerase [Clostridia bacterium]|nr:peptidylprolyl isomerase [Clostridia bacterium]
MKKLKSIIAVFLIVALCAASVACLDDGQQSADDPAESSGITTIAPDTDTDVDADAIAITLGNLSFTVADLQEAYDYYVEYYEYYGEDAFSGADVDFSEFNNVYEALMELSINDLLSSNTVLWQADIMGVTLTEDDLAEVEVAVEDMREQTIQDFMDSIASSDTSLTDDELREEAIAQIESTVQSYYSMTFEDYLDDYRVYMQEEAIITKVHDDFVANLELGQDEVDGWIEELRATQQETYAADPLAYRTQVLAYEEGSSTEPALYAPEGFVRVQMIEIAPEGELDENYETYTATMAELEAEYGALVLNGSDPERQEEIISEYATLKANVESTYTLYIKDAQTAAAAALERVNAGEDFASLMSEYNTTTPSQAELAQGELVYILEQDSNYSTDLWGVISTLPVGGISEIVEIDGTFYIVKVLGEEPSGDVDASAYSEDLTEAATSALASEAWDAQYQTWYEQAKQEAVLYPETYESLVY